MTIKKQAQHPPILMSGKAETLFNFFLTASCVVSKGRQIDYKQAGCIGHTYVQLAEMVSHFRA
jgi:hypothetical protein